MHIALTIIKHHCRNIGLHISIKCVDDILKSGTKGTTLGELGRRVVELDRLIQWEMSDELFLHLPPEKASRYDQVDLFGSLVAKQFSSASYDIQEAGNCFATSRPTACVFHLMRVLEIGLGAFAAPFNVPSDHINWHNIIEGIESKIRSMGQDPNKAPDWKTKQEAYSQAASGFMFFKEVWRNYTAPARGNYTEEQADGIFRNMQAFMHRLAEMGFSA